MRVDKATGGIHGADAVGVAVGCQAKLELARAHDLDERLQVTGNRFGVDAVETGIHLVADLLHLAAGLAQQARQVKPPGAVHGIDSHRQIRSGNGIEVDQAPQVRVVGREGIEAGNHPLGNGGFILHALWPGIAGRDDTPLDFLAVGRARRPAKRSLELDAIVARRVVAGRDHDAAVGLLVDNRVARHGCG